MVKIVESPTKIRAENNCFIESIVQKQKIQLNELVQNLSNEKVDNLKTSLRNINELFQDQEFQHLISRKNLQCSCLCTCACVVTALAAFAFAVNVFDHYF